jgi:predicted metalloprotease with PDZ domain
MEILYKLSIPRPETHMVNVSMYFAVPENVDKLEIFLPSWSPGSYLMREYAKNIRSLKVEDEMGQCLFSEQISKNTWEIDFKKSELEKINKNIKVTYDIYCHELTVRTSHVDATHAFIHGPSTFMGVVDQELKPKLEIELTPGWNKISTGLKDISPKREIFLYEASDYDEFIDAPIEIGNQETDGFMAGGKPHNLAFYGSELVNDHNLKEDIKKIVEHIQATMVDVPYDDYTFITHFAPKLFGGLEHLNSTALQYCSYEMASEKGYKEWLELVAHEYFHLWNVKRIRPKELGPFDYRNENYTNMHWLTEGLTSFMDQLFVYRCGFYDTKEYLEAIKTNINRYLGIPGRKYHSLEQSSFNAWVKLYRADENHNNSSISYYLKGGLVFFAFNLMLMDHGKDVTDLIKLLWDRYQTDPANGVTEDEVFEMIKEISSQECLDNFISMIKTYDEIDFVSLLEKVGVKTEYTKPKLDFGFMPEFKGERVFVKSVVLDGPAHKSGLNAGDEIISVNGMRFLKSTYDNREKYFKEDKSYSLMVSRLGYVSDVTLVTAKGPRLIEKFTFENEEDVAKALRLKMPSQ